MLSMDPLDGGRGGSAAVACIGIRIVRAEEQTSLMMQRYTAYVVEVSDFGHKAEVGQRYSDFETLHRALLTECPGLHLPPMPPKGVDGTDVAVVAQRKVELEKILRAMLASPEVLMEKQLLFWKFLNLPNPAIITARFIMVPRCRPATIKTLAKLGEPKYKDDLYRLGHPAIPQLLIEGLRELRLGNDENGHWARQPGSRTALCQLLAIALGCSEAIRGKLIESDVVGLLLGIVEREESALDDARTALNVVVAREADRFGTVLAEFLRRGGLAQLGVLATRPKCQEFVAKLLWLAWDAPARAPFAQPGGQGLRLLQALMRSPTPTCALLGAVLLAGLIANGDFDSEPAHRAEALRMVKSALDRPEAASDQQFTKTLCGANSALGRVAGLLEDSDLAPLILNLLCEAKPPPAKLGRIAGNLAAIVSDRGGTVHGEETRARAAELLLHIQGAGGAASTTGGAYGGGGGGGYGSSAPAGAAALELERCEGIAMHEESLESALRAQLEEGVAKGQQALQLRAENVHEMTALAQQRLQALPAVDFRNFDKSFAAFKIAREALERVVRESEDLHRNIERQLQSLQGARPSSVDPWTYKERLLAAERLYTEVRTHREALAAAEAESRETSRRAEASSSDARRAAEQARRLEEEISALRLQRSEKETQATKLRHKANTPSLDQMKQQAAASIERNVQQVKELQTIGQRVQQGDPDYLKEGESREQKIAELASKLSALKRQHQQLLQQQKELDFNPLELASQASRLEAEAAELDSRIRDLEARRFEAERQRDEQNRLSTRDMDLARSAQDRRAQLSSRLATAEQEAKSQLASLQPMIQEHHAGWQRLIAQQKRLDTDQAQLGNRLEEAGRAAEMEATMRADLGGRIEELMQTLQGLRSFLGVVGSEPQRTAPPKASYSATPASLMEAAPPLLVAAPASVDPPAAFRAPEVPAAAPPAPAAPISAASAGLLGDDDFDAFLREDPEMMFSGGQPAAPTAAAEEAPATAASPPLDLDFADEL